MVLSRLLSVGFFGLSLAAVSLPAAARPEIASGDQWLTGIDQAECLTRVDDFIRELEVPSEAGDVDRTGYFDDGVFRIICYNGGPEDSMVLVFASHQEDAATATQFMQFALSEIAQLDGATAAN